MSNTTIASEHRSFTIVRYSVVKEWLRPCRTALMDEFEYAVNNRFSRGENEHSLIWYDRLVECLEDSGFDDEVVQRFRDAQPTSTTYGDLER